MAGAAKAWVNFNGTGTVAIRESFNVSSITDNGTGNYTANFSAALADANYAVVCTSSDDGTYPWTTTLWGRQPRLVHLLEPKHGGHTMAHL